MLLELEAFFVGQVEHAYEGGLQRDVLRVQAAPRIVHLLQQPCSRQITTIHFNILLLLFRGGRSIAKDGFHGVPQLILEALDVDLLPDGELVQLDLLVEPARCIEAPHRLHLEHVAQVVLQLHLAVVAEPLSVHLFKADLDLGGRLLLSHPIFVVALVVRLRCFILNHSLVVNVGGRLNEIPLFIHVLSRRSCLIQLLGFFLIFFIILLRLKNIFVKRIKEFTLTSAVFFCYCVAIW